MTDQVETRELKFEFFGIPRLRTGVAEFSIQLPRRQNRLGDALELLRQKLPTGSEMLFEQGRLRPEFSLNISGERFTRDLDVELSVGDSILIFSADAGG